MSERGTDRRIMSFREWFLAREKQRMVKKFEGKENENSKFKSWTSILVKSSRFEIGVLGNLEQKFTNLKIQYQL